MTNDVTRLCSKQPMMLVTTYDESTKDKGPNMQNIITKVSYSKNIAARLNIGVHFKKMNL